MKEAEFPLVIVAMEEIIEIRLREVPPVRQKISNDSKKSGKKTKKKQGSDCVS
jgi:hypothetical protein